LALASLVMYYLRCWNGWVKDAHAVDVAAPGDKVDKHPHDESRYEYAAA